MFEGRVGCIGPDLAMDTKRKLPAALNSLVDKQPVDLGNGTTVQAYKTPYGDFILHHSIGDHWNHFLVSASGEIKEALWTEKPPNFFEVREDGLYSRGRLTVAASPSGLDFNTFVDKILLVTKNPSSVGLNLNEVLLPKSDKRQA